MADIHVIWDEAAVLAWSKENPRCLAALDALAARVVVTMKAFIPVSPVMPVYARPLPVGSSHGPVYRGRGLALPKPPSVPRYRAAGDAPLRPSGYLRSSVRALRLADGSVIIGPTAPYAGFVDAGTPPHVIRSHGSWPLRNRATGQVFGPVVNHPGTHGAHFIAKTAATLVGVRIEVA